MGERSGDRQIPDVHYIQRHLPCELRGSDDPRYARGPHPLLITPVALPRCRLPIQCHQDLACRLLIPVGSLRIAQRFNAGNVAMVS